MGPEERIRLLAARRAELMGFLKFLTESLAEKKEEQEGKRRGKKELTEDMERAKRDGVSEVLAEADFDAWMALAREGAKRAEAEKEKEDESDDDEK